MERAHRMTQSGRTHFIFEAMRLYSPLIRQILDAVPGKRKLGIYRFMPAFFLLGAALEFSMINWNAGEVNFYRVYKRKEARRIAEEEIRAEAAGYTRPKVET